MGKESACLLWVSTYRAEKVNWQHLGKTLLLLIINCKDSKKSYFLTIISPVGHTYTVEFLPILTENRKI